MVGTKEKRTREQTALLMLFAIDVKLTRRHVKEKMGLQLLEE